MQDVAVDVAAPIASLPRALARTFERLAAVPASAVLASMVAVSFVLRELAALTRVTPYMVPDEYYYRTLAHSLATTGQPLIRGHAAHFPALLAPIVTAPFQWFDPVTAYRLTQAFDVLAMSLAAVPAYLLARRLGLGERLALGCGAVTITSPALFYASFILSEPIAYPLALTALYAGACALDRRLAARIRARPHALHRRLRRRGQAGLGAEHAARVDRPRRDAAGVLLGLDHSSRRAHRSALRADAR